MSDSLESQAAQLGIPLRIVVDDSLRYSYCSAHAANLTSIEGKQAFYSGECDNGHEYDMDFEIEELKKMMTINTAGEYVIGQEKGYDADELEEY